MVAKICAVALLSFVTAYSAEKDLPAWVCALPEDDNAAQTNSSINVLRLHAEKNVAVNNATGAFFGKHEVPDLDHFSLSQVIQEGGVDNIISFWAPWCPHCRTLCISDQHGNLTNAPLEVLSRQLEAESGPRVFKFNVQGNSIPTLFKVKYIPAVYILTKGGLAVPYQGNPHDIQSVRSFAYETSGHNVPTASFAAKKVSLHGRV